LRRGDSNPTPPKTKSIQNPYNTPTELNRKPPEAFSEKQFRTLPIHKYNTSEHQTGANMVHKVTSKSQAPYPPPDPRLNEILGRWPNLPEYIRAAVMALIDSSGAARR
jgi:hypothetical protein